MKKILSFFLVALFSASAFASTYVVAGASEILGSNWNKDDANNVMALVDGVYTLVKENVTLAANTYDYKIIMDGNWDVLNKDNRHLAIAEDGVYDVTFTFVESQGAEGITAVAEKKGSAEIEKHYLVVGEAEVVNGASWNNDNADNLMVSNDEGATYRLSIENLQLEKKDYEFKIVEKGTWTAYYEGADGKNAKFSIDEAAIYTIEYVFTVASSTCVVNATKTGSVVVPKFYIAGSMTEWDDEKIPVFDDSYTLSLAAGKHQLKVVDSGAWLGIDAMSDVAGGLYKDQDGNICFILGAAGNVTVNYKKDETFTLVGTFVAPEIKLIGINGWEEGDAIALEAAEGNKSASKTLNLNSDCSFKVILADEWLGKENEEGEYRIHRDFKWVAGLKRVVDEKVQKSITLDTDVKGEYTFTYDFAEGKLTVSFPDPVLANGFYLIGNINGVEGTWTYADLTAERMFAVNPANEAEYMLGVTLADKDEFQVVRCDYDQIGDWYPGGLDGEKNYKVAKSGKATIYFRPGYDGDESWHYGCIQVVFDEATGVDNTEATVKAVKSLENGMLIIEKNGVRFNAQGQMVR